MNFTSTWKIADPLAQYIIYLRKSRKDMEAEALGQTDTLKRHRAALLSLSESRALNVVEICEEVVFLLTPLREGRQQFSTSPS